MRAVLLAAGRGLRFRPLTDHLPKAGVPVLGRPLAEQVLTRLRRQGVAHAAVNSHHLAAELEQILRDTGGPAFPEIVVSREETLLGTGGGLRRAALRLGGEGPIVAHNADSLSDVDLAAAVETHESSGRAVTLVVAPLREPYTPVGVDDNGRVVSIGGRPAGPHTASYLFTGVQIVTPRALHRIPDGPGEVSRDLWAPLIAEGDLGSYVHRGFWWEFGDPRSFLEGCLAVLGLPDARRAAIARTDAVRREGAAVVAAGTGADFHAGIELRGRVALGMACHVGEGTSIEDSVLMPGASVGPGSRLRRVLVSPGTEIPAGTEIESALAGASEPGPEPPPEVERHGGWWLRRFA